MSADVLRWADDVPTEMISTLLEPAGRTLGLPVGLVQNRGKSFQGCIPLGDGFVLDESEARAWIAEDPKNANVLFPFLNGEDLNSRPDCSASRWVIDFYDRSLEEASKYRLPMNRIIADVKPVRERNNRKAIRERWWQYAEKRPGLRRAIEPLDEILAITLVSKAVMPVRIRKGAVISNGIDIFVSDSFSMQAVLSSSIHQVWAITYGSTLETRVRYTLGDVFETFPQPGFNDSLESIGSELDDGRREMMLRRDLGLTKLYNLVNDPGTSTSLDADVAWLRELHVRLDHAVMEAYGWQDIPLEHGFHTYRQMERWTVSPGARVEILDRLLEENHRRADAEAASGMVISNGRKAKVAPESQQALFS